MAKFTRTYITCELSNGQFFNERVLVADQLQYEKTARANGWTPQKDQTLTNLFMGWHSLKRTGQYEGTFDDFQADCIDLAADNKDVDTETGEEIQADAGDPTR